MHLNVYVSLQYIGAVTEEGEMEQLIFDGIVAGAAFLRFIGTSSCASDGQSLLRSLYVCVHGRAARAHLGIFARVQNF